MTNNYSKTLWFYKRIKELVSHHPTHTCTHIPVALPLWDSRNLGYMVFVDWDADVICGVMPSMIKKVHTHTAILAHFSVIRTLLNVSDAHSLQSTRRDSIHLLTDWTAGWGCCHLNISLRVTSLMLWMLREARGSCLPPVWRKVSLKWVERSDSMLADCSCHSPVQLMHSSNS